MIKLIISNIQLVLSQYYKKVFYKKIILLSKKILQVLYPNVINDQIRKILLQLEQINKFELFKIYNYLHELSLEENYLFNFLNPQMKIFCDICQTQIFNQLSILTQQVTSNKNIYKDYCVKCFIKKLTNLKSNQYGKYLIRRANTYSLTTAQWNVRDQIMFIKGLQKYGKNWDKIFKYLYRHGTKISVNHYEKHYNQFIKSQYLKQLQENAYSKTYIPPRIRINRHLKNCQFLSDDKFESHNQQMQTEVDSHVNFPQQNDLISRMTEIQFYKSSSSQNSKKSIQLYSVQRGQFMLEYDPFAQSMIANLQFNSYDTEQEISLKEAILASYWQRIKQREKRRDYAVQKNLLNLIVQQKQNYNIKPCVQPKINLIQDPQNEKIQDLLLSLNGLFQDDDQRKRTQKLFYKYENIKTLQMTLRKVKQENPKIKTFKKLYQFLSHKLSIDERINNQQNLSNSLSTLFINDKQKLFVKNKSQISSQMLSNHTNQNFNMNTSKTERFINNTKQQKIPKHFKDIQAIIEQRLKSSNYQKTDNIIRIKY